MKQQPVKITAALAQKVLGKDKQLDALLMEAFSKEDLGLIKTTDIVISLEAGLQVTGETIEAFTKRTEHDDLHDKTQKELQVIVKALNPPGWKADYKDPNQPKYYPLHFFNPRSGFRFSYYYWTGTYSAASVGSRFAFATAELAEFAGKHFIDKYKILYTS